MVKSQLIEELLNVQQPSEAQLSPDGQYVAFVYGDSGTDDKNTPAHKAIYVAEVSTGDVRLFTGSDASTNDSPCWSPNSQRLIFVSNRTDETQLYSIDLGGGEARVLTNLHGAVTTPQWSPDGKFVAFLYAESQETSDPIVIDEHPRFQRVWLLTVATGAVQALTSEAQHIFEYSWSPDGTTLALIAASHSNPAEGWYHAQLYTVRIDTGDMQQVCVAQHQIGRPTWSPDGSSIAFLSGIMSDEGNLSGDIYVAPAKGGQARCMTPDIDHSITWIEWRDGGIVYGGRHIESAVLGCVDPQNGASRLISHSMHSINGTGSQQAEQVSIARNNTFAAIRESFSEPPNVYIGSLEGGQWRQLTNLPVDQQIFPPLHVENKHWVGPNGMPVQGFLVYPPDYQPGKRYPLFLNVHGGPTWSYTPRYINNWARLLAARGCLVLMPNPRGSLGRGHAYQSANVGDLGGGDWQDANLGVDCLIEEGLADPERLAVGGWSYGGYLTAWAVTQTTRFRCAIAGASITNYESNYGVVSNREWQTTMFGSYVYDQPDLHRSRSPLTFVKQVKTPTLLVHGACDTLAPVGQAIEFYTALKHLGVPAQLVIYPREPHGFVEKPHRRDLLQRIGDWVDLYLLG